MRTRGTSYLWQRGQWKDDRPACTIRAIVPPQPGVTQGKPVRP
jgi:hypothetical protein